MRKKENNVIYKWLSFSTWTCLSVIIFIPLLRHTYPDFGSDILSHTTYFKNISSMSPLYYGQYLVGKLFNLLPFNIEISFLWFNFIVLAVMIWTIGLAVSLSINFQAGMIASLLVFASSQATYLFQRGQIFDIVNIGIFLPCVLLCLDKFITGVNRSLVLLYGLILISFYTLKAVGALLPLILFLRDKKPLLLGLALGISLSMFRIFHTTGVYILLLIPIVIAYEVSRNKILSHMKKILVPIIDNRYLMYSGLLGLLLTLPSCFAISTLLGDWTVVATRLSWDGSILMSIFIAGVLSKTVSNKWLAIVIAATIIVSIPNILSWLN